MRAIFAIISAISLVRASADVLRQYRLDLVARHTNLGRAKYVEIFCIHIHCVWGPQKKGVMFAVDGDEKHLDTIPKHPRTEWFRVLLTSEV